MRFPSQRIAQPRLRPPPAYTASTPIGCLSPYRIVIAVPVAVAEPPREDFSMTEVGAMNVCAPDRLRESGMTLSRSATKHGSTVPQTGR